MRIKYLSVLFYSMLLISVSGQAKVNKVTESGFSLEHTFSIKAEPNVVFSALVNEVGQWWSDAHTYSGKAKNMTIEARAGGCFCETLTQGSVEHLRVVYIETDQLIRFSGGLGPLQTLAVSGSLTVSLTPGPESTRLNLTYLVGGFADNGLKDWAAPVDGVLLQQFQNLKRYIESANQE